MENKKDKQDVSLEKQELYLILDNHSCVISCDSVEDLVDEIIVWYNEKILYI